MLTTRELASLFWLAVLVALLVSRGDGRAGVRSVGRLLLRRKLAGAILAFAGYVGVLVYAASRLGAWNPGLATDTLLWFFTAGLRVLFSLNRASTEERFFVRTARDTVGITALLEFYVNLVAFPLPVEVIGQPVIALLLGMSIVAGRDPAQLPAKRFVDATLGLAGLGVMAITGWALAGERSTLDMAGMLRSFALPIWLTLGALLFLYGFCLISNYEQASLRVTLASPDRQTPWRAKVALVLGQGMRNGAYLSFAGSAYPRRLAEATSVAEARQTVRAYHAWEHERKVEEARAAEWLRTHAGVAGVDDEGRQLDQREFAETKRALEWLAICEMGWYRDRARYRDDLLPMLSLAFKRDGLPADHGLTLAVRKDGQAWHAWRRTVTGWCLGIGASGPPPCQCHYEGAEPPNGLPGADPSWGEDAFDMGPDW